jgi:hypothetical protein
MRIPIDINTTFSGFNHIDVHVFQMNKFYSLSSNACQSHQIAVVTTKYSDSKFTPPLNI